MKERIIKLLILLCTMTYCTNICRANGIPVVTVPNEDDNLPHRAPVQQDVYAVFDTTTYTLSLFVSPEIEISTVEIYKDGINWSVFQEIATYRTCLNHINWGWNGAGNGYFLSQVLNAYSAIQSDLNDYTLENGHNYNYYIDVNYFSVWH